MKIKFIILFVLITAVVIGARFYFLSTDNQSRSMLSEQNALSGRNDSTSSSALENADQLDTNLNNLDLIQEVNADLPGISNGRLLEEEMAYKEREFFRDLVADMRRRSDAGVTVLTREESALVSEWWERTGQYAGGDTSRLDYEAYDLKTLVSMGQQGDLKALSMVIVKARLQPSSPLGSSLHFFRREAVAAGSIPELYQLGKLHLNRAQEARELGDEETFRQELVDGLAYAHVQIARGQSDSIMTISKRVEKYEIQGDDELLVEAEQRGRELYTEFADLRRERGWGEFDNSVPAPEKRIQAGNICKNDQTCVAKMLNK